MWVRPSNETWAVASESERRTKTGRGGGWHGGKLPAFARRPARREFVRPLRVRRRRRCSLSIASVGRPNVPPVQSHTVAIFATSRAASERLIRGSSRRTRRTRTRTVHARGRTHVPPRSGTHAHTRDHWHSTEVCARHEPNGGRAEHGNRIAYTNRIGTRSAVTRRRARAHASRLTSASHRRTLSPPPQHHRRRRRRHHHPPPCSAPARHRVG